ncbi:hypothetical protein DL240_01810 [Lujinxingia litoralis]|uniref:Uncharacterized protein n=1 Tax=Lujinxingia litoralis TaxID=2211119 RepID=A0A328CCL3_9DELT|nr:hypothetical protein [Lujinxingia litoralis]RAL24971.1 hypothetical protein DL240_01810 [Lujinxingia litoralis]
MSDQRSSIVASLLDARVPAISQTELESLLQSPEDGPLLAALLLTHPELRRAQTPQLHKLSIPASDAPSWLWALLASLEQDAFDDAIDQALGREDQAPAMVQALFRAGADWYHESFVELLDESDVGLTSAALLGAVDPEELSDALEEIASPDELIAAARGAALAGASELFDTIADWRQELTDELSLPQRAAIDGALASLAPHRYARQLMLGELERDWLADDRAVADFLTRYGLSPWVETLAVMRTVRDRDGFDMAAALATSAALLAWNADDISDDELLGEPDALINRYPAQLAFQMALGEDDGLPELLVEVGQHDALIDRGLASPGVRGLPLSAGIEERLTPEHIARALARFAHDRPASIEERVALVHTLGELEREFELGNLELATLRELASPFATHPDDAVRQMVENLGNPQAFTASDDWGGRGLAWLLTQVRHTEPEARLHALAQAWFCGPIARAPIARDAFAGALYALLGLSDDDLDDENSL